MADEKVGPDSLRVYQTGAASDGGAQTDPDASLGKYRSSTLVEFVAHSVADAIANITINFVSATNGIGNGALEATGNDELKYTPPGGAQGAGVTILNGETKMIPGNDNQKFVIVSRTTADNLTGTATITITDNLNNAPGFDDVSSAEASAGDTEYRCLCFKNDSANSVTGIKVYVGKLGTDRISAASQLPAAGAGTVGISAGDFSDWPDSGWCRIEESDGTLREIVYYSSKSLTELAVPATGRECLSTTAAAGANDDNIFAVPGIRLAKEAPSAQPDGTFTDKTGAGEGSQPAGLTWRTSVTDSAGYVDIGTLTTGQIYGLWIEYEIPEAAQYRANMLNYFHWKFSA